MDDNPAEREIVRGQLVGTAVPEIGEVTDYIRVLDRSGYLKLLRCRRTILNAMICTGRTLSVQRRRAGLRIIMIIF